MIKQTATPAEIKRAKKKAGFKSKSTVKLNRFADLKPLAIIYNR